MPSNWDGIDRKTKKIVRLIKDRGYDADIIFAFKRDGISLQRLAVESGLGFIGKSGLVITESFGPAIRFSGILTDAEIKIQKKLKPENSCGDCVRCIVNCPAGAIEKKESFKCSGYTEGLGQKDCSICVDICTYSDEGRRG